jgi:predicted CXXCH cytochrome family protein
MGECISCHDPHAEDNRLLLHGGEGAGHCGLCHQATVEAMSESRHNPQRLGGDCLMCHTAHTSEWPGLLSDRSGDQCLRCHAEVRETIDASLVAHQGAMTDRHCVTCHAPHASPEMAMLRDDQATVCLACHDEPVEAVDGRTIPDMTPTILEAENVHGPVDHGHCSLCHSVHGSQFPRLLNDLNPEVVIGPFDLRNYGLCFQCHDQGLVTDPETTTATDFRHAGINLHHLHVENKGRGRACSTCHVVHGGNRPRLMADFASFEGGGWKMPLGFTLTDRGGNCAPGCHEPRSYVNTTGGNE